MSNNLPTRPTLPCLFTVWSIARANLDGVDTDTVAAILAHGEDWARGDAIDEARHVLKIKAPGRVRDSGWGPNWG